MEQNNINEKELKVVADMVYASSGIVFKESNLTVLISRLTSKLKEKEITSHEYIDILQKNQQELTSFIDFVTTNFTSFFRNIKQFDTLKEDILPDVVNKNSSSKEIRNLECCMFNGRGALYHSNGSQ